MKPKSKPAITNSIQPLYVQLGDAIADVVVHPDCPAWLHNELTSLVIETINRATTADPRAIDMHWAHDLHHFLHIVNRAERKKAR
jgi:hypothetical protein